MSNINLFYFIMYNKCSMGTLTNNPTIDLFMQVIMTQCFPPKFVILHMVGGVVNSTKHLFLQEYDRKHQPSNGHTKQDAV